MGIEIKSNQIVFSSRKKYLPTLSCKLISLFICPACKEILKAFFETEKPVPWLKYEEVEDKSESRLDSIVVPGGQGLIDKIHNSYNPDCDLEIYWAVNTNATLKEWLEKNYEELQFQNIENTVEQVKLGKIAGLVLIEDKVQKGDFLLGYNKKEWEGEWNHSAESYERWEKKKNKKLKQTLKLLGLVKNS